MEKNEAQNGIEADQNEGAITYGVPARAPFSLMQLSDCFKRAMTSDEEDVDMFAYLDAFGEIVKFLELLGEAFHFVTDVKNKIAILKRHLGGDAGAHYSTVKSMIEYEVNAGLIAAEGHQYIPPYGCRTLLRLHRALECILLIFLRLHDMDTEDSSDVAAIFAQSYEETVSKHHIELVRKATAVAITKLPNRHQLLAVLQPSESQERTLTSLREAAILGKPVYDVVQRAYAARTLLDLL